MDTADYTRLLPDPTALPPDLTSLPRWVTWDLTSDGKKLPKQRINDPQAWLTLEEALAAPGSGGIGFVFTNADDIGGIDLDSCRDPNTGDLDPWAQQLVSLFDAYTEISPSGTGVKIFSRGAPPRLPGHVVPIKDGVTRGGKRAQVEAYVTGRFFAVTGNALPGTDPTRPLDTRAHAWLKIIDFLSALSVTTASRPAREDAASAETGGEPVKTEKITRGSRNLSLTRMAGLMRRQGMGLDSIIAGLKIYNAQQCDPPLTDEEVGTLARSVTRYTPTDDQGSPFSGKIPPNSQHHLTLAFDRLDISFSYDRFNEQSLVTYPATLFGGETDAPVTRAYGDEFLRRVYFMLERDFFIKTSIQILEHFILDQCQSRTFHPIINYFNTLKWDETPRIDRWLETYLHVSPKNEEEQRYVRAVGRLTLLGAVRRIKHPGCKFDSMLVLEGLTNIGKSMSILSLVPNESWVLEDLSLGVDAKVVMERAEGKWLIEVSELVANRKSDINRIKSFLSLKTDVARKAYGRATTKKPRSFIFIGTTNEVNYLEDRTGNRRYLPVRCGTTIDFNAIAKDRDQLWAEALLAEPGADLFLSGDLFKVAASQQAARETLDDWETFARDILGEGTGWVRAESLWRRLGRPLGQVTMADSRRLGSVLTRLGFQAVVRYMTKHQKALRVWIRMTPECFDPAAFDAMLEEDRRWDSGDEGPTQLSNEPQFI